MVKTYNQKIYVDRIRLWIPDIDEHDLKFLCNQAAKIYKRINDGCVDNFRTSRLDAQGKVSDLYLTAYERGCCGFKDETVENPLTGNRFKIGFNYGH